MPMSFFNIWGKQEKKDNILNTSWYFFLIDIVTQTDFNQISEQASERENYE